MNRSMVFVGTCLLVLSAAGGWAAAEETTTTTIASTPATLFSVDAYIQAKAGVDSHPWSDPLDSFQGAQRGYITRGELVIRLAEVLGLEGSTACYFSDVIGPEDCFGAVGALYEAGILTGAVSSEFFPDQLASRQQATAWIVAVYERELAADTDSTVPVRFSYFESAESWLGAFRDRQMVSTTCSRGVANAYRLGIIDPSADGYLYPAFPVSEVDLKKMLDRVAARQMTVRADPPTTVNADADYPELKLKSEGPLVWDLEYQLAALKYRPGPVDGIFDIRTRDAVYAFQKVERMERDGIVGESFWEKLAVAETPGPRLDKAGDRVEVDLGRQVLFMIRDNKVVKIVHVSSGKATTATLWGHFEIEKKIPRWLHDSYNTTMYYSSFFDVDHRLAFHGYSEVPTWPASHGCVRTPIWMAKELYEEMPMGMHVYIYKS